MLRIIILVLLFTALPFISSVLILHFLLGYPTGLLANIFILIVSFLISERTATA